MQDELGISTNWVEFFPGAELAIDAGVKEVEKEGIESFTDAEGYGYIFE